MTKCFYKTLGLTALLYSFFQAHPQEFVYKHYGLQDGLPNSTIHSIFQDKDGFLWIGTESGLSRYDGTNFKTFTVKDGLPGNDVFGMFQDSHGRIWLELYKNSIAYIYQGKIFNQENDSLLRKINLKTRVFGIAEDASGNVGICDMQSLYILSGELEIIKCINSIDNRPLNAISLFSDQRKDFILFTYQAVYRLNNYKLELIRRFLSGEESFSQNNILGTARYVAVNMEPVTQIYLAGSAGAHISVPGRNILKYSAISDSVLSINTGNGAILYNINDRTSIHLLPGLRVSNTYRDKEKNLWLGTISKGLFKLSSQYINNSKIGDGKNDVWFISKEKDKIIEGNNNLEIYEFNEGRFTGVHIPEIEGKYFQKIYYYETLKGQNHFLAFDMGMMNYSNGRETHRLVTPMLKQVLSLDSNRALVSDNYGAFVINKSNLAYLDTIWQRKSMSSLQVHDSVLIGTISGLFILEKQNGKYRVIDSLLQSLLIQSILESPNHMIWVASAEDGVYCYKNGRLFRHFSDSSGLSSSNIRCMFIHDNDIWIGTDKGLIKVRSQGQDFHITKYSTSDGLPSNTINTVFIDGDMVYIGTPEGLCFFDEKMIEATSICNLVLTRLKIGDSVINPGGKYSLSRTQRLIVEFSGISMRSELEMNYRYRLKGLDDEWQYTTGNSLEFPSLPYGDFELEIVAINKMGKESLPLKIPLQIKKPIYKTNAFLVLIVAVPLLLALMFYNRRMNILKQRQLQKLQQEIKMLELEQMALRLQMNPHFIFNCINTIQQLIVENDAKNTSKFIISFSDLVRQTLDNASEITIPLNDEIRFLTNYCELERIKLEDRFSYAINTAQIRNTDQVFVPNMVIQPFVENAIKHGIRYKKDGKGFIEVSFEKKGNFIRCTITDNGVGREKAIQMKKDLGISHTPKGMNITMKRIESLNILAHGKTCIEIEDLKDERQGSAGTRVTIDFYKTDHHDKNNYNR